MESQEKKQDFFSLESSQSKHVSQGQSCSMHSRAEQRHTTSPPPGSTTQASLFQEQPPTSGGGTHPSKEYLLVFGMSIMSMKPLFPAKGRDGSYRGTRWWA